MTPRPLERLTSRPVLLVSAAIMLSMGLAHVPATAQEGLPEEVTVEPPFVGVPSYEEDFQDDEGGWEAHTEPAPPMTWERGTPTSGPGDAAQGDRVWATNLDGDYRPYECGVLLSPTLDLTDADTAQVSFEHWYEFYRSASRVYDAGVLLVTEDEGDTFERVTPAEGGYDAQVGHGVRSCLDLERYDSGYAGLNDEYASVTVDLDAYAGQEIQFAFGFASGSSSDVRDGWYVDAFRLTVDGDDVPVDEGAFTVTAFEEPEQPIGWEWGTTTTSTGPSFDEPTKLWGTHLDGDHGRNECSTIESPPIELGGTVEDATPDAALFWDQWYRSSSVSGGGVVQIGVDGEYTNIAPDDGYPGSPYQAIDECLEHVTQGTGAYAGSLQSGGDDMETHRADISEYVGEEVTIRYVFATTDSIYQVDGWYVNDVRIEVGAGPDAVTIDVPDPSQEDASAFQPVTPVYDEDFDEDDGGWTVTGTSTWEWGVPVSPPDVPTGSLNMWGTDLLADPDTGRCSFLDSPPIELPDVDAPGVETAQLTLETYRDLAPTVDGAVVMANGDDGHWYILEPDDGYDDMLRWWNPILCLGTPVNQPVWTSPASGADDWQEDTFDLSSFMGEEIQIRLAYASGHDDEHRGVYLDQATVEIGAGADVDPASLTEPQQALEETCQDDVPGWDVQRPSATWCRSIPTTGPATLEPVWATDPHGGHGLGECSALVTDPIDTDLVPGLAAPTLTIDHFYDASRYTGGVVQVSDDGGSSWSTVQPDDGTSRAWDDLVIDCLDPGRDRMQVIRGVGMDGYEETEFSLRGYDGQIQIRFVFAGMDLPEPGWYIRGAELDRGLASVPVDALAISTTATQPDPAKTPSQELLDLAGPDLADALVADPTGSYEVVVTGPPHEDTPAFEDREDAMAFLDDAAAPFFEEVETVLGTLPGQMQKTWSPAPAVLLQAPLGTLEVLASLEDTRHMAYDHDDSIQLIEPLPGSADGISVMNSEGRTLIQAEEAWEEGYTGDGMRISVIDTGIDGTHEAFLTETGESRIAAWLDLVSGEEAPYDDHGHGTHVAGTAAGSSDYDHPDHGTFEETGVAPDAELIGVKFLNGGGSGSLSDALDALEFSFENGADITSNSWGANCQATTSIISMVKELTDQGMLSVFAAGNAGPASGTVGGPACGADSVTVGAVDADAEIASFSSRGPCTDPVDPDAEERICPDVVAKGKDVRSAVPRDGATGGDPSGYQTWSGTSMATPHVAGAAALSEQIKRDVTGSGWDTAGGADKMILEDTAYSLPSFDSEPNDDYGEGLVQVMGILHVLEAGDEAHVVESFGIEDDQLRIGERSEQHFWVRNYGPTPAEGTFQVTLDRPDGTRKTLEDTQVSLGLLGMEAVIEDFRVDGDTLPGTYTFAGTFDYEWEHPDTGEIIEDEIHHEATFTVVRPYVELDLDGLEEDALPGLPQPVTFHAVNTGNEAASGVELRLTVPDAYEFLPPEDADLTDPDQRYASPPPDEVHEDDDEVTLVFDVGSLPVDASTQYEVNLVGTVPDDYTFLGVAAFRDAEQNGFAQGTVEHQTIQGPLALVPTATS